MLVGDSNGRAVAVPVPLILALVERVQRMVPVVKGPGPQVSLGILHTLAVVMLNVKPRIFV